MKSLQEFKSEKVDIKSFFGGLSDPISGTRTATPPPAGKPETCADYFIDRNGDGKWTPGEPGNIPSCP